MTSTTFEWRATPDEQRKITAAMEAAEVMLIDYAEPIVITEDLAVYRLSRIPARQRARRVVETVRYK